MRVRRRILIAGLALILPVVLFGVVFYLSNIPPRQTVELGRTCFDALTERTPAGGPLHVLATNPRYFTADGETAVLLTGSHTWANLVDSGFHDPPVRFEYAAYLDFLSRSQHNFFRLWTWEETLGAPWWSRDYYFDPPVYERPGPEMALDGKPKFDLRSFNPDYFTRLRERVAAAAERGIYVSVMLFNAWSNDGTHTHGQGNGWRGHPFNAANNVNAIDGDVDGDGNGDELHTLLQPAVTAYQEAYLARVIDTVNDLDNVLYEISNESYANSREWQYHVIDFIRRYELSKPKQHPVGMTSYVGLGTPTNGDLAESSADWFSPNNGVHNEYADDPPASTGDHVVVLDTDHIWGIGGSREWVWKSFLRGYNVLFMDAYDGEAVGCGAPGAWDIRHATWKETVKKLMGLYKTPEAWNANAKVWTDLRTSLGDVQGFARRLPLARLVPRPELSSTGYVLAGGTESAMHIVTYLPPATRQVELDLTRCRGPMRVEWFDPERGTLESGPHAEAGAVRVFDSPFALDAVLHVHSETCPGAAAGPAVAALDRLASQPGEH